MMTEADALCILNAVPGIGSRRIAHLLKHFGSGLEVICHQDDQSEELKAILSDAVYQNFLEFSVERFLEEEHRLCEQYGAQCVSFFDDVYPNALRQIADPPAVLYVSGNLKVLSKSSLAIVGSRRASMYGLGVAEQFARECVEMGIVVISGLARGIDTFAHSGAVKFKGETVAVLGSGLANIYPQENVPLARKIIECGGALVSEFPMATQPLPGHFPRRNRIISGLSLGTLVVEAAQKSGALITADFALEQGKEVFAVPGQIGQGSARGTNRLIQQGAKLVSCLSDILEELSIPLREACPSEQLKISAGSEILLKGCLTEPQRLVYSLITQTPVHIDELTARAGMSSSNLNGVLFELELQKLIRQNPGKIFERVTA